MFMCSEKTDQHYEFMCLGTVKDAVGSNCFPEVFVDVVVCTSAQRITTTQRVNKIVIE